MGLFSAIGSLFGPVGTALGTAADGIAGNRSEKKRVAAQNQLEMEKFVRLRDAAEAGGFHPLEALRSGAEVNATAAPRLMSSLAMSNAFDTLATEISGEGAAQRKRQAIEDEIRERELENLKIANSMITQPTLNTNRPPKLAATTRTDQGPRAMTDIANPTPVDAYGNIDPSIDDGGTGTTLKPQESVVGASGDKTRITAGPDLDEMVTGALINASQGVRRQGLPAYFKGLMPNPDNLPYVFNGGETGKMNDLTADYYTRNINDKPDIKWDPAFGSRKPRQWRNWDNKQKMEWIYRNNRK